MSLFQLNIEPNHTTLAGHSYEHDIVVSSAYVFGIFSFELTFLILHWPGPEIMKLFEYELILKLLFTNHHTTFELEHEIILKNVS